MNLRVDAEGHAVIDGKQTEIGGNDRYVAMCRKHFMEARNESAAHSALRLETT
jgi:thymidine kinase